MSFETLNKWCLNLLSGLCRKSNFWHQNWDGVLYSWELDLGSCGRPNGCLVEGPVRTLKKYFKTTCREFRCCITVGSYRSYSDESRTKCLPWDIITLLYIWARKMSCEKLCISLGWGRAKLLVGNSKYWFLHLDLYVIRMSYLHTLFNPSKRTGYPSSTSGFRRLISLQVMRSRNQVSHLPIEI